MLSQKFQTLRLYSFPNIRLSRLPNRARQTFLRVLPFSKVEYTTGPRTAGISLSARAAKGRLSVFFVAAASKLGSTGTHTRARKPRPRVRRASTHVASRRGLWCECGRAPVHNRGARGRARECERVYVARIRIPHTCIEFQKAR